MSKEISIRQLLRAIKMLPEDNPVDDPRKWYRTQKEHWIGWLSEYHGPGAYGRVGKVKRDAQFAYNHIVEPKMLIWLATAAGVRKELIHSAKEAAEARKAMNQQSAGIRKYIPWESIQKAIWKTV